MNKKAKAPEVKSCRVEGLGTMYYSPWIKNLSYDYRNGTTLVCVDIILDEPLDRRFDHIWFIENTHSSILEHEARCASVMPWTKKITQIALELYRMTNGREVIAQRLACAERHDNCNITLKFVINSAIDLPTEYLGSLAEKMAEWIKKDLPNPE